MKYNIVLQQNICTSHQFSWRTLCPILEWTPREECHAGKREPDQLLARLPPIENKLIIGFIR